MQNNIHHHFLSSLLLIKDIDIYHFIPTFDINIDYLFIYLFISETIQKFRSLRKNAQIALMNSLEKAIWNWMDTYPNEFADLQVRNTLLTRLCFIFLF